MNRVLTSTLAVLCVATCAVPTIASADRVATKTEKARIVRGGGTPARCLIIRTSTVDSRFSSVRFRAAAYKRCKKYAANGIEIHKKVGKRYRSIGGMSDCQPGNRKYFPGVSKAVYDDLTGAYCDAG